jgi:ATP-dependent Clp protease ATP-binding subunit ClpC
MEGNVTPKVKEIIKIASEEAKHYGSTRMEPEHILVAILLDNTSECIDALHNIGSDVDKIFNEVSDYLNTTSLNPSISHKRSGAIPPSELTKDMLKDAVNKSKLMLSASVDIEHLIYSMLSTECEAKEILTRNGVSGVKLSLELISRKSSTNMKEFEEQDPDLTNLKKKSDTDTPVLDNFCKDITKMAEEGKIDVVVGREKEIKRVSQILSRRKKNNPVLLGEPGVGKTSIAEGLAKMIAEEDCPSSLLGKRIYSLDIPSIIAGTKYRGQFEGRMKSIVEELINHTEVILYIDELHTIVGAGNTSGSLDISNILKPALARGELQVIGSTTLNEYRENIEKDGALSRRFQQVMVEEPTIPETINILENIKDQYEKYHRVNYSKEIIEECVKLADRYISDKFMPDKAIDIMDECGAMTNTNLVKPDEIKALEERRVEIENLKTIVVKKQEYEKAVEYKNEATKLELEIAEATEKWMDSLNSSREKITIDMVNTVVSEMSGVPVHKLSLEDNKELLKLEDELKKKVIGQDEAISIISKSVRRNRLGLRDKNRPQGSYIFLGKSGSGKTLLAKEIAKQIFHNSSSLIRIDMSEYMEKFAVSRLIGAPPGYVGHEEGGKLTEAVRRKPYSVILFDEIEKAHPDVFNLLLQLLDEGMLTDSLGRKVDFKNTLIILTSNVGVKEMSQFGQTIGFDSPSQSDIQRKVNSTLNKAVKKKFAPEFLNRIDDVITFNELTEDDMVKIVDVELKQLQERVSEMGYSIKFTKTAKVYLAKTGYDKEYGARPLRRLIQNLIEDAIADMILGGEVEEGGTIKVGTDKKRTKLTFK